MDEAARIGVQTLRDCQHRDAWVCCWTCILAALREVESKLPARLARVESDLKEVAALHDLAMEKYRAEKARLVRIEAIIESEEELCGYMPDDVWDRCSTREGASAVLRAAVRATKRSILNNVRAALTPDAAEETTDG